MKALLSETYVRKQPKRDVEIHDTKLVGFVLRCRVSGTHVYRYRLGRAQWLTLGRVGRMTADEARAAATQLQGSVAKKALATVAEEGSVSVTDALRSVRAEVQAARQHKATGTWKGYLTDVYEPYATVTLKCGTEEVRRLRVHFAEFDDLRLKDITPFAIERWRTGRFKTGTSMATINRDLAALRGAMSRAVGWKLLSAHPMADVKPFKVDERQVVRYLDVDEENRLREALQARDSKRRKARQTANEWRRVRSYEAWAAFGTYTDHVTPLVLLALNTGLRRGELFNLRWQDIDLGRAHLVVRGDGSKSGQTRVVNLNREAVSVLKAWQPAGAAVDEHVFAGKDGKRDDLKTAWLKLAKDAKLGAFRFHDLRHTFASKLVMAGVDLNTVRELLGHADLKMTLRYAHLGPSVKAAAVEKLAPV